jgi:phosphotriesterase-related protein
MALRIPRAGGLRTAPLSRREWLTGTLALLGGAAVAGGTAAKAGAQGPAPGGKERAVAGQPAARRIHTVTGAVAPDALGLTLMHEHVLVDFIGADKVSPSRYDVNDAFTRVLPHLRRVRELGCRTLVECTPAYLGRDPGLLKRLSDASGVTLLTNTGYYGAAKDKHLPAHAFSETAERLAARWIREATDGIDGSGIKPAFMKIGVDGAPLSDVDAKLVRAAAGTHRETGLPIASHTGSGAAALEELELLDAAGVPRSAFIWVHAQSETDASFHTRAARSGAWVEFDGISPASVGRHVDLVTAMKSQGLLERVLVSHDAGWYRVGEPGGGQFRPYDTLFTTFVPALKAAGCTDADMRQLLVANPRRALGGG